MTGSQNTQRKTDREGQQGSGQHERQGADHRFPQAHRLDQVQAEKTEKTETGTDAPEPQQCHSQSEQPGGWCVQQLFKAFRQHEDDGVDQAEQGTAIAEQPAHDGVRCRSHRSGFAGLCQPQLTWEMTHRLSARRMVLGDTEPIRW